MTNCRAFSSTTPSRPPIAGSAGSIESMPSAVNDISEATSAMNSGIRSGAPWLAERVRSAESVGSAERVGSAAMPRP